MRHWAIGIVLLLGVGCASRTARYANDGLEIETCHSVGRHGEGATVDYAVYMRRRGTELEIVRVRAFADRNGNGRLDDGEETEVRDFPGPRNILEYERTAWEIDAGDPWLQVELGRPNQSDPEVLAWPLD